MDATYKGKILSKNDKVLDFRGDTHYFGSVSRAPRHGKSGKIITSFTPFDTNGAIQGQEFYSTVIPGLEIME